MDHNSITAEDIAYIITPASVDKDCLSWIVLMQDDGDGRLAAIPCPYDVEYAAATYGLTYLHGDRIAVNLDTAMSLDDTSRNRGFANSLATWKAGLARSVLPLRTAFEPQQIMAINVHGASMLAAQTKSAPASIIGRTN